ncbi:hypothetical protein TNIN_471351 [Trichonephila inaurata madagascariensis]|uniref:Uncharacterized protein n=1 Tax=Trichonephila inaurata madagascariensis TaxID=2747483 RepID=A0A8X6YK15_9ARAC|nr:hypothetical protein TNIN_471351 [Trichonephila inaurata madagascariensis]
MAQLEIQLFAKTIARKMTRDNPLWSATDVGVPKSPTDKRRTHREEIIEREREGKKEIQEESLNEIVHSVHTPNTPNKSFIHQMIVNMSHVETLK